jgi:hypothetical protein
MAAINHQRWRSWGQRGRRARWHRDCWGLSISSSEARCRRRHHSSRRTRTARAQGTMVWHPPIRKEYPIPPRSAIGSPSKLDQPNTSVTRSPKLFFLKKSKTKGGKGAKTKRKVLDYSMLDLCVSGKYSMPSRVSDDVPCCALQLCTCRVWLGPFHCALLYISTAQGRPCQFGGQDTTYIGALLIQNLSLPDDIFYMAWYYLCWKLKIKLK